MTNLFRMVLVQSAKGGIGKSWLTLQIAYALAIATGKRVLIITTDNLNNIPTFAGCKKVLAKGLEHWLEYNEGDFVELRKNLYYISLNTTSLKKELEPKFYTFLNALKAKFDYIFIDGTPVIELNKKIAEMATDIIIPTFLDKVTTEALTKMIKTFGLEKVKAVIPNRAAARGKLQNSYYLKLSDSLKNTKVVLTCPIQQSNFIGELIEKGKTIYDTTSCKLDKQRAEIAKVIEVIR